MTNIITACQQCPTRASENCISCTLIGHDVVCLVCKGSGIQHSTSHTLTTEGWSTRKYDISCIWCEGSGKQTPAQAQEVVDYRNAWCKCPSEVKNNQDNHIYQENRHSIDVICGTCEKYIQVG